MELRILYGAGRGAALAMLMLAGALACGARESATGSAAAKPAARAAVPAAAAPGKLAGAPRRPPAPPDSARVMALLDGVLNATCPLPGVASGGQVGGDHVKGLAKAGFRTVLDLRAPDEPRGFDEAGTVKQAGLDYVILPVTSGTLDDATFDRVRALMVDTKRHPVMVHCASGNRVGVMLLPWLVLDRGWSVDAAVAIAEQGGMRPSPLRDRALAYIKRNRALR